MFSLKPEIFARPVSYRRTTLLRPAAFGRLPVMKVRSGTATQNESLAAETRKLEGDI